MSYTYHWRKAMAISICLHMLLLAAAGYLAAGWAAPVPVEEVLLEMDLISDPAERAGVSPQLPDPLPVPDVPRPAPPEPTPVEPVQTETEVKPTVTTSELSVTEAQPAAAPAPAQPQAGGNTGAAGPVPISGGSRSGGIAAPGILSKVDPAYPSSARQAGQEGTVVLRIEILANGRTGEISVSRSTGYPALDEAAIAAVRKWQFVPAKDLSTGRTVACTTTLPVSFRLR